ncbi:uncharacterized protein LOC110435151 [Sorghum bicolor]|uniref:RRM domain-containing protein n=1 Tax=Sorghum bicolor TaxID=4558 RepID=A0A194YQ63_SORBI|nr:uncharacterized protein LOC110435151 [Sorghum bicolor]KXG29965.1 hypothetical protein SORBI_3004G116200 [Sorghum bicolor]|eukprot:XP_021316248.1 uncharacterized protein LOC110435151 [Sorghum bicolor]
MASHPYLKKVRWLFSRMLFSIGVDPFLAILIITFWMYAEEDGCVDYFECINAFNESNILVMVDSVRKYLVDLVHLASSDTNSNSPYAKEVIERIDFYLDNICFEALGDLLEEFEIHDLIYEYAQDHDECLREEIFVRLGIVTNLDESSSQAQNTQGQATSALMPETTEEATILSWSTDFLEEILENADELLCQPNNIPKEERTLLVIFSDGYPLTEDELYDFFSWNYGEVEEIVIEEPRLRPHPLCALIIFSSPNTLFSILNGDKRAHFIIKGKDLWVQRNVEDKRAHFTINGKDLFYWG